MTRERWDWSWRRCSKAVGRRRRGVRRRMTVSRRTGAPDDTPNARRSRSVPRPSQDGRTQEMRQPTTSWRWQRTLDAVLQPCSSEWWRRPGRSVVRGKHPVDWFHQVRAQRTRGTSSSAWYWTVAASADAGRRRAPATAATSARAAMEKTGQPRQGPAPRSGSEGLQHGQLSGVRRTRAAGAWSWGWVRWRSGATWRSRAPHPSSCSAAASDTRCRWRPIGWCQPDRTPAPYRPFHAQSLYSHTTNTPTSASAMQILGLVPLFWEEKCP